VDAFVGAVIGSSREVGMAGALAGVAEGLEGVSRNPAALAVRDPLDDDFFDWSMMLSFANAGSFGRNSIYPGADFEPSTGVLSSLVGLQLQFGPVGVGAAVRLLRYTVPTAMGLVVVSMPQTYAGAALALADGEWVLGAGVRVQDMDVSIGDADVQFTGTSPTAGLLWQPLDRPYRVGLSFGASVSSRPENTGGESAAAPLALPKTVSMPLEVRMGFAYQFGERPFNHRFVNYRWLQRRAEAGVREQSCERMVQLGAEHGVSGSCRALRRSHRGSPWMVDAEREREAALAEAANEVEQERERRSRGRRAEEGRYHLLSAEAALVGTNADAVAVGSFIRQEAVRSGSRVAVELRLGYESEPWRNRLRTRLGGYLEPARVSGEHYRPHGTASLELRLFHWDWLARSLALTGAIDASAEWMNLSVGVSFW